jgi:SAM-dependent methyltransferase
MTSSTPDPILLTAQTYEEEALAWHAHTAKDRHAWQPSYDRMTAALPLNALILDLGCGSGEDVPAFLSMGHRVVGLDISRALLCMAAARSQVAGRLFQGDLRALPFADSTFGGVWACGSLHHVPREHARRAVNEIARVLAPGGVFGVSVERGNYEGFVGSEAGMKGQRWYTHYEPPQLRGLLEAEEFEVRDEIIGEPSEHSTNGFIAIFAGKP